MAVNVYAKASPVRPVVPTARPVRPVLSAARARPPQQPQVALDPGPVPPPKAQRHCVVCGHPGVRLTCVGCGEPMCGDRVECCADPKGRPLLCTRCEVVGDPAWGEW